MARQFDGLRVSGSAEGNFKCSWTIENFSSLNTRVGKPHNSNKFRLVEKSSGWYLKIYPGGVGESSKGCVCVYLLRIDEEDEKVKYKFYVSLRNSNGDTLFDERYNEWKDCNQSGRGYNTRIQTEDIVSKLVNDVLVVIVEATYCATYAKNHLWAGRCAELSSTISATENWRNLWANKENTDCVIFVDGEDIRAHSLVLGTHSKVFAAMFKHDTMEKDTSSVIIKDFDRSTMVAFVEFAYTGTVPEMNFDLALELLRASDKYEVNHLKSYCSNYLFSVLDDANVCQILASADMNNAQELRSDAMEYIWEHLSEEDLEAQRSVFKENHELLWSVFRQYVKKRRVSKDNL